jgi:hypothetical protein
MRCVLVVVALAACKPGGVTEAQQTCARAATMFERCEDLGSNTPQERELTIDRWRGLCRAVLTGETRQLMPNALELYQSLDEPSRQGLRAQAECTSRATTCDEYRVCQR